MSNTNVKYRDWVFNVDRELTIQAYANVLLSGTENCSCNYCKNYIAYRDKVFPEEINRLFYDLGIDYKKEVEIIFFDTLPDGLHRIGGWFHFKGHILTGKDCRVALPTGGYTLDLTATTDKFSVGFANGNDLTHFADKIDLIQVEFMTCIPWVIDKSLEVL
ncbi:hypothetical protein [Flavobacterium sp.]|uniref:hypothetical protein n=1 Tax=Flavobacterium sp. TaxID=239 RepID=UPI00262C8599|nr:hypothetical protein [Flavobacterium sp.]